MTWDVESVRAHFPALAEGAAHFDGPGGSQVPDVVAAAVTTTLQSAISNRGRRTAAERRSDAIVLAARQAIADLVGGDRRGVVFGRSMTQLTYDLARTLAKGWGPGDEVVVTRLDHDANIRPWVQAADAVGATVRWLDFDPATGELDDAATALSERTVLLAVTGASNLIGTRPALRLIADQVHAVGALIHVDGVHLTPHAAVDVAALGADFYACSPYKFLGPHCGALVADPALLETLTPDKLLPSSNEVPERFELGTLPYELLAGCTAAVDFLAGFGGDGADRRARLRASMALLESYEAGLLARLEDGLRGIPGTTLYSRAQFRTPTVLLGVDGMSSATLYQELADRQINAPAGSFYALEASRRLGLGDGGALRLGIGPYTTAAEVDRLLDALAELVLRFRDTED